MAKVVWRRQARDDLDRIILYIEQFDAEAAADIGIRLFALGESLADFPQRGRPCADDHREMTIVPPYKLRYRVAGDDVVIVSIRHGRQRPRD